MALTVPDFLFLNRVLNVQQNVDTYGDFINEGVYDYIFKINVASLCSGNISLLFQNASFAQPLNNLEAVDVTITLNTAVNLPAWENAFNDKSLVTVEMGQSNVAFQTLQPNALQNIGDRLLEVVAHKLFGHGQARAAIKNDYQFYSHDAEIWD